MKFKKLGNFDELQTVVSMTPVMADVYTSSAKREKELNDMFKDQEKTAEKFVKDYENRETKKVTVPAEYKKMKLSEAKTGRKPGVKKSPEEKWDLWTRVYNNLSSELDPQEKNREVKDISKDCRYEELRTDYDGNIVVYGEDEDSFEFAKKVAEYFKLKTGELKPNRDEIYKYTMTIYVPEE